MKRTDWFLTVEERGNPATTLDRHHPGTSWSEGNLVVALAHGHQYFERLHEVLGLTVAGDLVLFTDWRGDLDERLSGVGTEVVAVLRGVAMRGVLVRGLIWRSHPDQIHFSEQENVEFAELINAAGGEVFLDERVRRAGSHHQKLVVVRYQGRPDDDVAFVGGIDLCHGRNDDVRHQGDPQALLIDDRYGPRPAWHDLQMELRGPVIGDLVETFRERWEDPLPLDRGPWRRRLARAAAQPVRPGPLPVAIENASEVGSHAVQVLRTYPSKRPSSPFAPNGERSIARAYSKAFRRARRLIYVEDQYLWSFDAARALGEALRREPELLLVVVVPKFPDDDGWLAGPPNRVGQLRVIKYLQQIAGPRLAVYDLEVGKWPVYVHAKVCVIDDVWMTVGSDNFNRRSWTHDSEISCAVLDDTLDTRDPTDPAGLGDGARVLPRSTRLALWQEHLGLADVPVDPGDGFAMMRTSADALDVWHESGRVGERPPGRLRNHRPSPVPVVFRPLSRAFYRFVSDPDGRPWVQRLRRSY
jgi:phosphatidylserine/phosphatidylglycerophosphate/cardiolipin synthase-like enzyme